MILLLVNYKHKNNSVHLHQCISLPQFYSYSHSHATVAVVILPSDTAAVSIVPLIQPPLTPLELPLTNTDTITTPSNIKATVDVPQHSTATVTIKPPPILHKCFPLCQPNRNDLPNA